MEALSIQTVKADTRPAGTQAQSGLGDIFQALLRDSVERQEAPVPPPRFDDRPERYAPRRSLSDERIGIAGGDRRDRPYDRDTDYRAHDVPAAVESRPAPTNDTVKEREAAANTEARSRPRQSIASDQPSDNRDTQEITPARDGGTPAPDGVQGVEEQIAVVSDIPLEPTRPNATAVAVTPIAGSGGQTNTAAVLPGTATGAPHAAAPAANQAQSPASSQSAAPGTGTSATPTAPASTGGNGFSVQVTVTPAQVVATPNAGLGGGAATAAIAVANTPGLTGPAKPGTGAAQGAATATPAPASTAPTDGQAAATQSASIAAAAASTQKQDAGPAGSEARTGAALNNPLAKDAPIQSTLAEAVPARLAQSGQAQGPGGAAQGVTGQNITDQSNGAKAASAQNQHTQAAPQVQTDQAANASAQTGGATAPAQGPRAGDPGTTGGSAGSTDAASSRAASVSTVATGGFTQATLRGPDTLGSLTRSGGAYSTATNQVAVEIQKAVNAGKDHIRIRLHPAELGQIDVSLKVRHDGTVKAIVTIDRPETFDLMQRDARGLERALQDAGLKTDSGSLTFNLRGGDQHAPSDGQRGQGLTAQSNPESDSKTESPPPEADTPAPFVSDHTLDIRV